MWTIIIELDLLTVQFGNQGFKAREEVFVRWKCDEVGNYGGWGIRPLFR